MKCTLEAVFFLKMVCDLLSLINNDYDTVPHYLICDFFVSRNLFMLINLLLEKYIAVFFYILYLNIYFTTSLTMLHLNSILKDSVTQSCLNNVIFVLHHLILMMTAVYSFYSNLYNLIS